MIPLLYNELSIKRVGNYIMNSNITESLRNNKYIKSYQTYNKAVSQVEKCIDLVMKNHYAKIAPTFIISVDPSTGRFVPIVLVSNWFKANDMGGYLMTFSVKGFYSI